MRDKLSLYLIAIIVLILVPIGSQAKWEPKEKTKKYDEGLQRVLVLDGSNVHNVGELQMHVANWGNFGSWPGSANTFSEAPSAPVETGSSKAVSARAQPRGSGEAAGPRQRVMGTLDSRLDEVKGVSRTYAGKLRRLEAAAHNVTVNPSE